MALSVLTSKLPAPLQPFGWLIVPLGIALILFIIALSILPGMVNKDAYGQAITMQVESLTGRSFSYDSMDVKLFPNAKITMRDVRLENAPGTTRNYMVLAPVVEIPISFGAAFADEASIEEVILYEASVELESMTDGRDNWHFVGQSGPLGGNAPMRLVLRNSEVIYTDKSAGHVETIQAVNGALTMSAGQFSADAQFRLRQKPTTANVQCSGVNFRSFQSLQANCDVRLNEASNQLTFKGDVFRTEKGSSAKGDISINHNDIREWLDIWYGQGNSIYSQYFANPIPLSINAELFSSHERWLLNASELVSSTGTKGSGFVDVMRGEAPVLNAQLQFDTLDLDALLSNTLTRSKTFEENLLANPDGLPYALTGKIRVQAAEWSMLGVEGTDLLANGGFERTFFELGIFQISLQENGRVAAKGRITVDETGPRFDGKVDMAAKRFPHLSPLLGISPESYPEAYHLPIRTRFNAALSTNAMLLSDIRGLFGESRVRGAVTIDPFASPPRVDTKLTVDKWDFTPLYAHWFGAASLMKSADELGYNPFRLEEMAQFGWIWKNNLTVEDARYFEHEDFTVQMNVQAQADSISASRFSIQAKEGTSLEGSMIMTLRDRQVPDVDLTINANMIDLKDMFVDTVLASDEERGSSQKNDQWTDRAFNFNPLLHFDMQLSLQSKLMVHEWFDAFDVFMKANTVNGRVTIEEMKANMFDGDWVIKSVLELGLIPQLSVGFTGAGVQLEPLFNQLVDVDNIRGSASLSGQLQATGLSFSDWMDTVRGAINTQSFDVTIDELDVGSIIAAGKSGAAPTALRKRIESSALTGETTFRNLEGVLFLNQGFGQFTNMALRSRQAAGEVTGNIRLADYESDIKLELGLIALAGRDRSFPKMVIRAKGPINSPQHIVETQELENFLSRR